MRDSMIPGDKMDDNLGGTLPGFESINRFWNNTTNCVTARLQPGEYYLCLEYEMITTVLGSCISACIRDPIAGVGGMNHFMLPRCKTSSFRELDSAATRYGSFAMEHLINGILKYGGKRDRLEIKLFGGGNVLDGMSDVGRHNIQFVKEYLETENLVIVAQDMGGTSPRKINYYPGTGRVMVKKLERSCSGDTTRRETEYMCSLEQTAFAGEIDLF